MVSIVDEIDVAPNSGLIIWRSTRTNKTLESKPIDGAHTKKNRDSNTQ